MKTCHFDSSPVVARGLCNACWKRERRKGNLHKFAGRFGFVEDRWNHHLNKKKKRDCWEWRGPVDNQGYGVWRTGSDRVGAHIVSYEKYVSKITEGYQLDHLCRNRRCVNPNHLEPVTAQLNVLRGISPAALNAKKTHCPNGHLYDFLDTSSHRRCRVCRREVARKSASKIRALKSAA